MHIDHFLPPLKYYIVIRDLPLQKRINKSGFSILGFEFSPSHSSSIIHQEIKKWNIETSTAVFAAPSSCKYSCAILWVFKLTASLWKLTKIKRFLKNIEWKPAKRKKQWWSYYNWHIFKWTFPQNTFGTTFCIQDLLLFWADTKLNRGILVKNDQTQTMPANHWF